MTTLLVSTSLSNFVNERESGDYGNSVDARVSVAGVSSVTGINEVTDTYRRGVLPR